jgi:hypothetical protein
MDGETFREAVTTAKRTELDRLGSSKLLVALTDADLTAERVLRTAAASEHAARETFRGWAATEADDRARAAFEAAAEQEDEHYDRVRAELDDYEPPGPSAMHAYLREREATVERVAAGLVGRSLVSVRIHGQVIGFFVNEADERRADLFRDLKADTEATVATGLDLIEHVVDGEDDAETAQAVAEYVIQVAYDEYADSLTALGIDPKPVC